MPIPRLSYDDVDKAQDTGNFQKHDDGKSPWSKFPWRGAEMVMTIMKFGAYKYGWDNWRKAKTPEERQRFVDAAFRHMKADSIGETVDEESQELALAHAACCLLFYLEGVPVEPVYPGRKMDIDG